MQNTKLDFSLETPEERLALVNKILEENPNPNEYYLEVMADYLIRPLDKAEKKEQKRKIISDNRKETIKKHEISYEGLVSKLESGEDGIHHLIGDKRRATKLNNKQPITQQDLDDIPELVEHRKEIDFWVRQASRATGKRAYNIQKIIKDMRQFQYIIRDSFKPRIAFSNMTPSKHVCKIEDTFTAANGEIEYSGVSFCDPKVCSAVLCNYSRLKQEGWDDLEGDLYFFMLGFEKYCGLALSAEPILDRIVADKIDGLQNDEIQKDLQDTFGTTYSAQHISSLYRNKIPALIAAAAEEDYLSNWYLNIEKGNYKKCSRCGETKLAHSKYFSKNPTSSDGFYSICKCCRNVQDKCD